MPTLYQVARNVVTYFTPEEFLYLNPGKYHSVEHALRVAAVMVELSRAFGREPEEVRFLEQVALVHDADNRVDSSTGARDPLRPARVLVTLEWIWQSRQELERRLGWSEKRCHEAMALVARTDYPFDREPRYHGTCYDGLSPYELYRDRLLEFPPAERARVMENALLLVFADQTANYTGSFREAVGFQKGLMEELHSVGVEADPQSLNTSRFLRSVGKDLKLDRRMAVELGVEPRLPPRERIIRWLPRDLRRNLEMNEQRFRRILGCPSE
ncbi:MAG: hypothetical protein HY319_01650 [Armatimonadetes bacterium]|nr:hypothetical protein [Armatimonadota bacterium]